jgi:hypothetical protein
MLDFLNKYILGSIGDQLHNLYFANIFYNKKLYLINNIGLEVYNTNALTADRLRFSEFYNIVFYTLANYINPIFLYNLLTIVFLILNSSCFFLFLKHFKINRYINLLFSVFFSLTPYFFSHFEHHLLLLFFPSILYIRQLLRFEAQNKRSYLLLAVFLNLQILLSVYLGYFLLLFTAAFLLINLKFKIIHIRIKNIFTIFLYFLILLPFINFFYLPKIYDIAYSTKTTFDLPFSNPVKEYASPYDLKRPLEDFFYFSSRPWYYVLPNSNHVFLGIYTYKIIDFLKSKNFWLAYNYFPAEHNASFLGYTVIFILILSFMHFYKVKNRHIISFFVLIIVFFLFSMPPYFTLFGIKIFLPSYLVYLLSPMIRSVARLSLYVTFLSYTISAIYISYIVEAQKFKLQKILIFSILLIGLSFDNFSSIKYGELKIYSETNAALKELNGEFVAAYPKDLSKHFIYNIPYNEKILINPPSYSLKQVGFDSENFTNQLTNCRGINYSIEYGVSYIITTKEHADKFDKLDTVLQVESENLIIKKVPDKKIICN